MRADTQLPAKKQEGFTLIELLVVIAIIGLLASIVLVSLSGARAKSRDARREADIKQIMNALELYNNSNNGKYPVNTTAASVKDATNGLAAKGLTVSFISAIPDDPNSSQHYYWISNASGASVCVGAVLETTPPAGTQTCANGLVPNASTNFRLGG